jgi:hypothetical protein
MYTPMRTRKAHAKMQVPAVTRKPSSGALVGVAANLLQLFQVTRISRYITHIHILILYIKLLTKDHKKPRIWTDSLDKRPKRKQMDMRFGTCNVRSMYRAVHSEQ